MTEGSPKEESAGVQESQVSSDLPPLRQVEAPREETVVEVEKVEEPALQPVPEGQASEDRGAGEIIEGDVKQHKDESSVEFEDEKKIEALSGEVSPGAEGPKLEEHQPPEVKKQYPSSNGLQKDVPLPDGELQEVPLETSTNTQITISEKPGATKPTANGKIEQPQTTTQVKGKQLSFGILSKKKNINLSTVFIL